MNKKTMEERLHRFDESIDIFDSLDKDPSSHWTTQTEKGMVLLKNLKWPGFVFYHTRDPVQWGSFYFGSGQENVNLPFMF
jgi:radial spoke head protein 9